MNGLEVNKHTRTSLQTHVNLVGLVAATRPELLVNVSLGSRLDVRVVDLVSLFILGLCALDSTLGR